MNARNTSQDPKASGEACEARKILIVRLGSLGDVIHAIPAQQFLARSASKTEIHWLVEPPYAELLRHVPGIHRVWVADTKRWRKEWSSLDQLRKLVLSLRNEKFDLALDFQGLVKSALLSRLSGAKGVRGFPTERLREKAARCFYSSSVVIEPGPRHQVELNLDLVSPPRYTHPAASTIPIQIPDDAVRFIEEVLAQLKITQPVLLNPGAGWQTKIWPVKRYAELALLLKRNLGASVLFTYGPGEEPLIAKARNLVGEETIGAFPTSILQLGALCGKSRLMVAGDTGPMHLAVALGTPVVALIGPGEPWRTGPFNPQDRVVQHERICPHPYRRKCRNHFCMDIDVDRVYEAVVDRLKSAGLKAKRTEK